MMLITRVNYYYNKYIIKILLLLMLLVVCAQPGPSKLYCVG